MRILLTGGCGFIGSNFVRFVLEHRPDLRVTNLDALTYCGNRANLADVEGHDRYTFVQGDVCDLELACELLAEADAVVHMAAESHVDRSIADARPFVRTNVMGTQTLLDALRRVGGSKRLVHVSTDEVYGELPLDRADLRFTEDTPLSPNSPYAASKAAADMLVAAYHRTYGLDVCITRCSNNLGPYQYPEKIIPLFVTNLIDGVKIPLYGDGRQVRDWIGVDDHCDALLAVLDRAAPGGAYNIGGVNEMPNLDLTRAILRIMDKDESMIEHVRDRPGHDQRYAIDASKLEHDLGWRPTRSAWPDTLERTVKWYAEHEDWWRALKKELLTQRR